MLTAALQVRCETASSWAAFAESDTVCIAKNKDELPASGQVWFRLSKEQRTLASGTVRLEKGGLALPVRVPEIKPGIALPFELVVRADSETGRTLKNGTLWVFSKQPFEPEHNLAQPRSLVLYDPKGQTEQAFQSIRLPHETIDKISQIEGITNAIIVTGEGLSLEGERGLFESLSAAVVRGNRILVLAPADGQMALPAAWRILRAGPAEEVFCLSAAYAAASPFDCAVRGSTALAAQKRFCLAAQRDAPVFTVTADAGCEAIGWDDAVSGGCFCACGLSLVAEWSQTPVARWLLVGMVERLVKEERKND